MTDDRDDFVKEFERTLEVDPAQLAGGAKKVQGIEQHARGLERMFARNTIYPAQVRDLIDAIKTNLSELEKLIDGLDPQQ